MPDAVRYDIEHVSHYVYSPPVRHSVMSLCMKPRDDSGQRLLSFDVRTRPSSSLNAETDGFGNTKHVLNIHREHTTLEIIAHSTVETTHSPPLPDSLSSDAWDEVRSWTGTFPHWEFTRPSVFAQPTRALAAFVDRHGVAPSDDPLQSLVGLRDTIHQSFEYVPGSTTAVSPIDHILETGEGVCQDYAHVMIAIARSWRVPTRYVSGYVSSRKAGMGAPQSATHAWAECYLPELGWTEFDPTNPKLPNERRVRVAVGRDYDDVSPTRGVFVGNSDSVLEVSVRMRPVEPALS
ncbi:MAG: transglutaminase family protein [Dehalococcoidia bacterium]|nr:transglutaminase family protein [Dehalococcoidia bacterium]